MRFALAMLVVSIAVPVRGAEPTPRERGDVAIHARSILKKYCSECHNGPQNSFDVLDLAQLTLHSPAPPVPWLNVESPERSQVLAFIADGSMPPGGRDRPTNEELEVLTQWVKLRTPTYPKSWGDDYALRYALQDWETQKPPKNVRYVSLVNRIRDDSPFVSLKADQDRLQAALDGATVKSRITPLQPVDPAATVFRIDIEKLGWDTPGYFWEVSDKGVPGSASTRLGYDLILLENPFPSRIEPKFAEFGPVLRGDWLMDALAPGSPLSADLRSMAELNDPGETPCGPKVRAFEQPKFKLEPSANPPITSWYGPERTNPFELKFTVSGKPAANLKVGEKFKLEVQSGVDAKFVLLLVLADGSIRPQPVGDGTVLKKNEPRELTLPTGSPFPVLSGTAKGETTRTEHYILLAAPLADEIPMPTFFRTEHKTFDCQPGTGPIMRFAFDKKFDTSKVARKVIPITISAK